MAESNNLVGIAPAGRIFGSLGSEDVRALRLCPAGILARGYEARRSVGIQHGDERRRGAHGGRKFEETMPANEIWPPNEYWHFHAAGGRYQQLTAFDDAMTQMYGAPQSLADYERKAQAMTYQGERAMFEAYARNKYNATGVIQWMLNNAR